jgi:hypothetical protein
MKFEATIETFFGKPGIKPDDDGTVVTLHCLTEDINTLKQLWRDNVSFYIVSGDELTEGKKERKRNE